MGQSPIPADALINQIFSFLAYLFPFLASVAFSLFLRKMDRYNSLIGQIHQQRQELKNTEAELEEVREELKELVDSFNGKMEDRMDNVVRAFQKKYNDLNSNLDQQTEKIDKSLNYIYETSKDKLKRETEHLIQVSLERVNAMSGKMDGFFQTLQEKQSYIDEKYHAIKDIVNSSLYKFEKFDQALNDRIEESVEGIEDKVSAYSKKYLDKLEGLKAETNRVVGDLTREVRVEIAAMREETEETHKRYLDHESDLLKNLDSKRSRLFEEFNEHTREAERNLEAKLLKIKDGTELVSEKVNTLDMRMEEKLESIQRQVHERVGILEKKFQERYDTIHEQTIQTRDSFLKGLRTELELIRASVDDLKYDAVSKRDDLLTETRQKTKELESTINKFIEKYLDDENKILKQTDQKKNEVMKELKEFEEHIGVQKDRIKEDIEKTLDGIKNRVQSLGEETFYKMKAVDEHFENLKLAMNESARDVLDQVELDARKITERVEKELGKTDSRIVAYVKEWQNEVDKMRDRYAGEIAEIESRITNIHIEADDTLETIKLEHIQAKADLESLYHRYYEMLGTKTDVIVQDIQNKIKASQDDVDSLLKNLQKTGYQLFEKQEAKLVDFGEKLIKSIEGKLERAKYQSEEVIESITKAGNNILAKQEEKIDKFNSTLDERISRQLTILIDRGQLQLDALESRIANYVQDVKQNIESNIKIAREDSERQISSFNAQILRSYKEIEGANNEFLDSTRKEFSKTKEDFISMKTGIESEINRVNELKNNLYSFLSDEGAKLKSQKIKSEELAENLSKANKSIEQVHKKADDLKDRINQLNSIDEKIKKLMEIGREFDEKTANFDDFNQRIRALMESLLVVESNEADASYKLQEIMDEFSMMQKRERDLQDSIQGIELKMAFLQGRDLDVKSIEAKFDKVEGLMMDLSARHKQIATMQNRIESLKVETESMKMNLEGLLEEADSRFEKLSEFLSVVDTVTTPYATKTKAQTPKKEDAELIKKKKATVLQLHENFDWNSETIAAKLNLEKSLVDTIINSKK